MGRAMDLPILHFNAQCQNCLKQVWHITCGFAFSELDRDWTNLHDQNVVTILASIRGGGGDIHDH